MIFASHCSFKAGFAENLESTVSLIFQCQVDRPVAKMSNVYDLQWLMCNRFVQSSLAGEVLILIIVAVFNYYQACSSVNESTPNVISCH